RRPDRRRPPRRLGPRGWRARDGHHPQRAERRGRRAGVHGDLDDRRAGGGAVSTPDIEVGTRLPGRTVHVDRERLRAYADASGDHNPIHQDEQVARSVGLPDVIAHGMWTMGAAIQVVSDWVGDPARVITYTTRFTNPVVVPAGTGADV